MVECRKFREYVERKLFVMRTSLGRPSWCAGVFGASQNVVPSKTKSWEEWKYGSRAQHAPASPVRWRVLVGLAHK